jgi:hypothetical protein
VCVSFESKENVMLTAGSVARIYRDGTLVAPSVNVPEGRMELRHLQPGQYEARDECGGRVVFEVPFGQEVVVVQAPKSDDGLPVVSADGGSSTVPAEQVEVAQPVYPDPPEHSRIKKANGEWRVAVPQDGVA